MAANKSNTKVVVVDIGGEFFVQPAAAVLEKGSSASNNDFVKIYNAANEDAVFYISTNTVFGAAVSQTQIIASKKSIQLQLDNGAAAGVYSYQVLMVASGKKAKGNSDPVIIVEN